jgi:CRISPR system Cascade subunit CasE
MQITRILIDRSLPFARKALSSRQVMHAAVESVFEGAGRKLWRLDDDRLLIVSQSPPVSPDAAERLGGFETKGYDRHLSGIANGRAYRFRLTANPVKRSGGEAIPYTLNPIYEQGDDGGRRVKHMGQADWLRGRAEGLGVEFGGFKVTASETCRFRRGSEWVTLALATFEGVLTVKDRETLTRAMGEGVGRAKAYGAGLLTVI